MPGKDPNLQRLLPLLILATLKPMAWRSLTSRATMSAVMSGGVRHWAGFKIVPRPTLFVLQRKLTISRAIEAQAPGLEEVRPACMGCSSRGLRVPLPACECSQACYPSAEWAAEACSLHAPQLERQLTEISLHVKFKESEGRPREPTKPELLEFQQRLGCAHLRGWAYVISLSSLLLDPCAYAGAPASP